MQIMLIYQIDNLDNSIEASDSCWKDQCSGIWNLLISHIYSMLGYGYNFIIVAISIMYASITSTRTAVRDSFIVAILTTRMTIMTNSVMSIRAVNDNSLGFQRWMKDENMSFWFSIKSSFVHAVSLNYSAMPRKSLSCGPCSTIYYRNAYCAILGLLSTSTSIIEMSDIMITHINKKTMNYFHVMPWYPLRKQCFVFMRLVCLRNIMATS